MRSTLRDYQPADKSRHHGAVKRSVRLHLINYKVTWVFSIFYMDVCVWEKEHLQVLDDTAKLSAMKISTKQICESSANIHHGATKGMMHLVCMQTFNTCYTLHGNTKN